MGFEQSEVEKLGEEKIETGKNLIERLNLLSHVQGVGKIQKKISAEITTLQNVRKFYTFEIYKFHYYITFYRQYYQKG